MLQLTIIKHPPGERNVQLSWLQREVHPGGNETLEIIWTPIEAGSWRDTLIIVDQTNIKRNIPLTFKSTSPVKVLKHFSHLIFICMY